VVCAEPSPQFTSTAHGASLAPGSVNEPRSKLAELPSSEDWFAAAVTAGGTLWTSTLKVLLSVPPSLALTMTVTDSRPGQFSPYVLYSTPFPSTSLFRSVVCAEPSPQFTSTAHGASLAPGSVNEPRSKLAELPSSEDWLAAAVTAGGTLWTSTLKVLLSVPPS